MTDPAPRALPRVEMDVSTVMAKLAALQAQTAGGEGPGAEAVPFRLNPDIGERCQRAADERRLRDRTIFGVVNER